MYNHIYQQLDKLVSEAIKEAENKKVILVGGCNRAELAYGVDKLLDEYLESDYTDLDIDRDADYDTQAEQMADEISKGARFGDYQQITSLASRLSDLRDELADMNWRDVNPATIYDSDSYNDAFRVRINGRTADLGGKVMNAIDALSDLDSYLYELQTVTSIVL